MQHVYSKKTVGVLPGIADSFGDLDDQSVTNNIHPIAFWDHERVKLTFP